MTRPSDSQLALAWHVAETLMVLSLVGLLWSWKHVRKPKFTLTSAEEAHVHLHRASESARTAIEHERQQRVSGG